MAGFLGISRGYDPEYPFKQMTGAGKAAGQEAAAGKAGGPEYYYSAAEHGGEPPGRWVGEGLAWLGIHDGDEVRKDDFLALFGEFRVPGTEDEYLGKRPRELDEVKQIFTELRGGRAYAELGREEVHRLWGEARAQAKCNGRPVMFFDGTFTVSKDISAAQASAMAMADEARKAGDQAEAAFWQARADGIREAHEHASRLGIDYLQREARYVRTGHHGKRADGVNTGRHEDAREIPTAAFFQHTNRDGEIHLHQHTLMLNKVETVSDGVHRAIDSRGLYRARPGANAVFSLALEAELTRRYGFEWKYSEEAKGRVLAAVPREAVAAFSSRRETVKDLMPGMVEEYRATYGRDPDQRAMWSMRQTAGRETRKGKPEGALDFAKLLRQWDKQSRSAELGRLTDLARTIWGGARSAAQPADGAAERQALSAAGERRAMAQGLAAIQEERTTWTRHDLLRAIHAALPDYAVPSSPELAWTWLEDLTSRTLAGEAGEQVACLTPEWPAAPKGLCRESDGRSIYRPHGAEVFATVEQLSTEQRLLAQAGTQGAPAVDRVKCAQLLGSDAQTLDGYIVQGCPVTDARTGRGLRMDQAVAGYLALTSGRRMDVITGPAGTGKTFTAGAMAEAWRLAGRGAVYGVAVTSNARNQLAAASPIIEAFNFAQFLGHTETQREELPGVTIEPDSLIIVDEATMPPTLDWDALAKRAARANAKIVLAGDHNQQGTIEAGGIFGAIARRYGQVQLNVAERVIHPDDPEPEWEADASLVLRAGGPGAVEALREYDDHGRLHGGTFEEVTEAAARHYLAEYLGGRNVLLTALSHQECGELSRRVQEYLLRWGKIEAGAPARLAGGAEAHCGDLVLARKNTKIPAGERGASPLINGDTIRVEEIGEHLVTCRRRDGWDAEGPVWGAPFAVPRSYLARRGSLGYALTWQTAQGRTVQVGITVGNESRGRRGLYMSLTRGTEENHGYGYPAQQDPSESGPLRADPEVERQRKLEREAGSEAAQAGLDTRDPLSIFGEVARRHDDELIADEVGRLNFGQADHLAALHSIWDDQVRRASGARFAAAVRATLPGHQATDVLEGSTDDLWRALRHAELAGKDGAEVLAGAVAMGSLDDARSVAAVLARRVRDATEHLPPARQGSWESRAPVTGDAETDRWLREEIGRGMDQRQERLGQHIADIAPVWATRTFGPVPEDAGERAAWEKSAGVVGAFRERFGWNHPGEAIGPRPATTHPEARAEWAGALEVMPRVDGVDVRDLTAGQLLARRAAAEREYAWQPPDAADELRLARKAGIGARVEAARAKYDAEAADRAGDLEAAARHRETERQHEVVAGLAGLQEEKLAEVHATRKRWNALTEATRRTGEAADLAAKQQGILPPDEKFLKDEPGVDDEREAETQEERDKSWLALLGLTPGTDGRVPEVVEDKQRKAREAQEEINYRLSQRIPDEDPDFEDIGPAWKDDVAKERDAVIQPPRPDIEPAEQVKERGWEFETAHPADREAGD